MVPKESNSSHRISSLLPFNLAPSFFLISGLSVVLFFISRYSFLLFHSLVELFSIIVAVMMFVVAWNTYNFSRNHFLMYLGCGYFWIALLDLLHTLIYKGMTVFPGITGGNPSVQFWIAGRYSEGLLLLTAPFFLTRSLNRRCAMSVLASVTFTLVVAILIDRFPDAYLDDTGLTPFKIYSEYLVILIIIGAGLFLRQRRALLPPRLYRIMLAGITLTIAAELTFTLYVSLYDLSTLIGHIFKFFSFWLVYEAVIHTTLHEPFTVLARNATTRTKELQSKIVELEQTRDQLIASEKMASLGRLVAGFAHEINTPVGIALGAASQLEDAAKEIKRMLASEEIEEKELEELLEIIMEGAELTLSNLRRAAELVQRFKRSSIDRASETLRHFRVREVIEDVLVSLHNNLKKTQVEVIIECPDELRIISVPGLIEQVLVNLIQNSLMHGFENGTKKGEIRITCSSRDSFQMVYQDNGCGMSAETVDHIFEPFYTTSRGTGSGLGMYISYNLIHHHHGTFYCESAPRQGVWFVLDLPLGTMEDLEKDAMGN